MHKESHSRVLTMVRRTVVATAAALLMIVMLSDGAAAQQMGVIVGRVVSAADATPVAGVVVRVEGSARAALTGEDGRYRIVGVPDGMHVLTAQRVGHATARATVTVGGEGGVANFSLSSEASVMQPVVVSATRELQRRQDASMTIEAVDGVEVRLTRAAHPAGILNRVSGVHVSELSGEGHSMAIRQPITTKAMYLFLEDGIPTRATGFFNHNALYEVNIPQSGGVEVIKGPGSALYGSDAIGGVVNVLTRSAPATNGAEVALEGGAHGYGRLLASGGLRGGDDALRLDLNLTRSDNWKEAAPFRRQSGTLRWERASSAGWTARTVLTGSNIDQQDVPAIGAERYAENPAFNSAPIAYREVQAARVSSAIERDRGASLLSVTPYARYNVLRVLPSWQLSFDPQTWDQRNSSLGMVAKYRQDFAPMRTRLIIGADADWSPGSFVAKQAVIESEGTGANRVFRNYTEGETHYDYDVTYRALSPYLHAELSPVSRLRLDVGHRYDMAGYDYRSKLAPLATGAHRRAEDTEVSYRHWSPKIGATMDVAPWLGVFASYRHGFRAPSQGQLFQQNAADNTVGLAPVKVDSYESGIRGQLTRRAIYQISAYDMRITDDIVTFVASATSRIATNAGETRHRGLEASVGVALASALRMDVSWSVARHEYVRWSPSSTASYSGKRIEQAPNDLGNVLLSWSPAPLRGGRIAAEWSRTGSYKMDPENTRTYAGHDIKGLHANVFVRPAVELFARAVNVTDERYAEIATYNAFQREQFTPGAPRTIYVGARYALQRGEAK